MGIPFGGRICSTDYQYSDSRIVNAAAPDPKNWQILKMYNAENAHVLKIKYPNCTNFEGVKVLVYKGKFKKLKERDPHFSEEKESPLARFRPDNIGWNLACDFADEL